MGNQYKPFTVPFMTQENPIPLKNYLGQDDWMYDYTLNIYEAIKPDKASLGKELDEAMMVYSNPIVSNALLEAGYRPRVDILARKRADMFEYFGGDEFLEQLDPMQQAAIQATRVMQQRGGELPPSNEQKMEEKKMEMDAKAKQGKESVPA